uniref:Uncharacterized protein MANES_01G244900 n=1 Tax=Rhizophora mucronata TaxID=61149 RepID=A0A2P2P0W7_RHIMU
MLGFGSAVDPITLLFLSLTLSTGSCS